MDAVVAPKKIHGAGAREEVSVQRNRRVPVSRPAAAARRRCTVPDMSAEKVAVHAESKATASLAGNREQCGAGAPVGAFLLRSPPVTATIGENLRQVKESLLHHRPPSSDRRPLVETSVSGVPASGATFTSYARLASRRTWKSSPWARTSNPPFVEVGLGAGFDGSSGHSQRDRPQMNPPANVALRCRRAVARRFSRRWLPETVARENASPPARPELPADRRAVRRRSLRLSSFPSGSA